MNYIDYNVFNLSINEGLINKPIASGKDYLILLEAPIGANVKVKLNNNQGDDIPLKTNYAIKAKDIENIYISADAVSSGVIKIGQANSGDGFEIITAPTINSIGEIGTVDKIGDNFAPKNISEHTITAGSFLDFDITGLRQVRFNSNEDLGIELENSGIKYPMLEDLINLRNLTTNIKFHNDNADSINLIIWSM